MEYSLVGVILLFLYGRMKPVLLHNTPRVTLNTSGVTLAATWFFKCVCDLFLEAGGGTSWEGKHACSVLFVKPKTPLKLCYFCFHYFLGNQGAAPEVW